MLSDIFQSCIIVFLRGILTFGIFFYGSHFFSISDVGLLAQIFAYIFILTAAFDSGYGFLLLRDLKKRQSKALSQITTNKLLLNAILLLIAFICTFIFAADNLYLYLMATLISVLISFQNFFGIYLRAERQFTIESSTLLIQCFSLIFLTAVLHNEISIVKLLFMIMFVRSLGILFLCFNIKSEIDLKLERNVYITKNSTLYGLIIIFSTIYFQVDTIIIGKMNSAESAGFYQNAIRLAVIGMMLMEVTNQVFQPVLVHKYINEQQSFMSYQRLVQGLYAALSMLICIFLLFFSKDIIRLLYGSNYIILDDYLHLVCLILLLRTFGLTASLPISLGEDLWPRIICVFLAALLVFSLNLIFIGLLKYDWGIAFYISILAHFILNTCYFVYAKVKSKIDLGFKPYLLSFLALLLLSFSARDAGIFLIAGLISLLSSIFYMKKINDYSY